MLADNLSRLIHPIATDLFFDEYWDRKPLFVSRSEQNYYSDLFSREDITNIIHFSKIEQSKIEAHKNGQEMLSNLNTKLNQTNNLNLNEIYQQYYEGSTLILRELHCCWKPISDLCRSVENILNCRTQVDMYLTPKDSQGLPPHFGTHGVFILQIEGFKTWKLYDTFDAFTLPISPQEITRDKLDKPLHEIVLKAGDLLYMPSGYVHEAFTSDSSSLHLSLGILAYRWLDLLSAALSSASEKNVSLRESLPVGFLKNENNINYLKTKFEELLPQVFKDINLEEAIEQLAEKFIEEKLQSPKQSFSQIDNLNLIGLDSLVQKKEGAFCHVFEDGDLAIIQFPGNEVIGSKSIKSAYQFIADSDKFAVSSLPNSLTDNSKLTLIRRLIREGLLECVDEVLENEELLCLKKKNHKI